MSIYSVSLFFHCHFFVRLLEILDIAFNFFGSEESIEAIVLMGRLKTLILYGNPVLGPTGEDPMFIYIEELIEKSSQVRRASESTLVDVEVSNKTKYLNNY